MEMETEACFGASDVDIASLLRALAEALTLDLAQEPDMGEVILRGLVSIVATVIVMPVFLLFATPYVLLAPMLRNVPDRTYWQAVGKGYYRLARRTMPVRG